MQPFLRHAYIGYLTQLPKRRSDKMLWVSDLGFHPFKAMDRIINSKAEDLPAKTISKMEDGNALEDHSAGIWARALHSCLHTDVPLYNREWSGYADVIVGFNTDAPVIIEHKTTDSSSWSFNKTLGPIKGFHACQLWLYGQIFQERYGIQPDLRLYYRSMGDRWAELIVTTDENEFLFLDGYLDDKPVQFNSNIHPRALRDELLYYYNKMELPTAPDGPEWDYAGRLTLV